MAEGARRPFPWGLYVAALAVIVILSGFPLFSVILTYLIADANGCSVNEAFVQPCVVMGTDLGEMLYTMGVMGWLMLVTLPFGMLAFPVWLVFLIVHLVAHNRAQSGYPQ